MALPPALFRPDSLPLAEQIEFFFAPPNPMQSTSTLSTLHLVRRELQDCLIGDVLDDEYAALTMFNQHRRVFATCLVLWAGIDLLAKFYAGNASGTKVGDTFRRFVMEVLVPGSTEETASILYDGMRNPMVHAFGLHGKKTKVQFRIGAEEHFIRRHLFPDTYVVSLVGLHRAFLDAVATYRARLDEPLLRAAFVEVFPVLGLITFTARPEPNGP